MEKQREKKEKEKKNQKSPNLKSLVKGIFAVRVYTA